MLVDPYVGGLVGERYILVEHEPHGQWRSPLDDLGGAVDVAHEGNRLWSLAMEVLSRHGHLSVVLK